MKFGQANVRSINTSFDFLESAIKKQNIKVMALSEIWHPDSSVRNSLRKRWQWIGSERVQNRGGGVALMIDKGIKVFERKDLKRDGLEAVWCNIYTETFRCVVGSVYIPPDDEVMMKDFVKAVDHISHEELPLILLGDFNARHQYWHDTGNNKLGSILQEYIASTDLLLLNKNQATRKDKIIDLSICSSQIYPMVKNWQVYPEVYLNSDHNLITFDIGEKEEWKVVEKWDFQKTNWIEWKTVCTEHIKDWLDTRRTTTDINIDYDSFVQLILKCSEEVIPKKKICPYSKGYWTPTLTSLAKKFRKAKSNYGIRRDPANQTKLNSIRQEFQEEVEKAKLDYLNKVVKELNPKDPSKYWKVINNVRNNTSKGTVQPIIRADGGLAVTDKEIFLEMKKKYGKEELNINTVDSKWFQSVEEEMMSKFNEERASISSTNYDTHCEWENADISLAEIDTALKEASTDSSPSPEEKIYTLMLKNGGEMVLQGMQYIFQKSWKSGEIPTAFKTDPKILLPKPGKENYNSANAYRPITLESVIGKLMERVVKTRLTWRLEVEEGISKYQYAYRKNKSCSQAVLRIVNSIQEANNTEKKTILVIMDYESCFERVWRAGLLKKAASFGICGRLWLYLRSFLTDRKYYLQINNYRSEEMTSKVGIPQGSVLSPTLCNLYTSDAMSQVSGRHAEYADDASLWNSKSTLQEALSQTNRDLSTVTAWCNKWNMKIAPEKTTVMMFEKKRDPEKDDDVDVRLNDSKIPVSRHKKVLGITIDDQLTFEKHVEERTSAGFAALKNIDCFISRNSGCTQSQYMNLFRSLVLPVMDYGAAATVSAKDDFHKHFNQVQRSAMLKATGCLSSTSTDTLEVLTNCMPIDLHMKLRQAQEVVRIAQKRDSDPLREEFNNWIVDDTYYRGKPTTFQLLMSRFNELRQDIKIENIEKEFEYSREHFGLSRRKQYVNKEDFKNEKDVQASNIQTLLESCSNQDVLAFTDGSALQNPGPTGAGAVIYLNGYQSTPVFLKKPVSKHGNNFAGEIVGIEIALEFLANLVNLNNKKVHILCDCQGAIQAAFCTELPTHMIENIINIKRDLGRIQDKQNTVEIHWVPGHKNLTGNELADLQAKLAAKEMEQMEDNSDCMRDSREAVKLMKEIAFEKWNRKYTLSDNTDTIQTIFKEVGKRPTTGEEDRKTYSLLNQLLSGHSRLGHHWSRIDSNTSPFCEHCNVQETVDHFIFHCKKYENERKTLENKVEETIYRNGLDIAHITLATLIGEIDSITEDSRHDLIKALCGYIRETRRFC